MAMTLSDIVVRHQVQQQTDNQSSNKNLRFFADAPNRYEDSDDAQKIVEVKIIDILYDSKVCKLVYMRNITNYVKQNPELIKEKERAGVVLDPELVTNTLLMAPVKSTKALADKIG